MKPHLIASLLAALAALAADAAAQGAGAYPNRPIRMISPFAAGGGSDILGRMIGAKYTEIWGQQVVLDARPGAGSVVGTEIAAKANPDGYTMIVVNASFAINETLFPKLPYSTLRDFAPVTLIATQPYVMMINQNVAAKDLREFVALAKAKPGGLSYSSSGVGSASHLATELFKSVAGVDIVHVPYKGANLATIDVIAGQVQLTIQPMLAVWNHVQAGRVRLLAVTSARRWPHAPNAPTAIEAGVPGFEATTWYMQLAPARTPPDILAKVHAETVRILRMPDIRERIQRDGAEPAALSREETAKFLRAEIERWGKVIRSANIKPE